MQLHYKPSPYKYGHFLINQNFILKVESSYYYYFPTTNNQSNMCRGIQEHHQANNQHTTTTTTTSLISCSSREIHVSSSHVNSSGFVSCELCGSRASLYCQA